MGPAPSRVQEADALSTFNVSLKIFSLMKLVVGSDEP